MVNSAIEMSSANDLCNLEKKCKTAVQNYEFRFGGDLHCQRNRLIEKMICYLLNVKPVNKIHLKMIVEIFVLNPKNAPKQKRRQAFGRRP